MTENAILLRNSYLLYPEWSTTRANQKNVDAAFACIPLGAGLLNSASESIPVVCGNLRGTDERLDGPRRELVGWKRNLSPKTPGLKDPYDAGHVARPRTSARIEGMGPLTPSFSAQ